MAGELMTGKLTGNQVELATCADPDIGMSASAQLTKKGRQILAQGLPHLECSRFVTVSHEGNITTLSTTNKAAAYSLRRSLKDGLLRRWGIGKKFTIK